ncbi:MAG: helix-turn-helix transcriptional regulator [Treponemataceae bacterium]|nr:helix-turn-helix transcriptional regulator [Treponema sp.]MDE5798775.1 helix-turn-helix transcriptional regulator [Treponemataceae bacterium]MDE7140929.1 helix-turn-helix transcriptional regulator [Treponemataceae bacterium]MDE7228132.1 helix-turn-helix transcriptional regulator [Treponemataceae bacterium]MDE7391537.1 helix-turn-helix transcriptional regulator [Treponemataceae bacterium]
MNELPIELIVKENVKSLRKKLGWSQELLAEKTGVSAPYITQIEAGKRTPSLDIVERLASALGVEYKSLFEPNDSPHASPADDFSRHLLESKLIAAVTDTIRREFMG